MKKLKLRLTYYWYKLLMKLGLKTDEVFILAEAKHCLHR